MSDAEHVKEKKEKKQKKEKKHRKHDEDDDEIPAGSDWVFGVKKYRGPVLHKDFIPALYHFLKSTVGKDEIEGAARGDIIGHYHQNFPEESRKWSEDELLELWHAHLKKKKRNDKRRGSGASPMGSEGVSPKLVSRDFASQLEEGKEEEEETKEVKEAKKEPEEESRNSPSTPAEEAIAGFDRVPQQPPLPPPMSGNTSFLSRDLSPEGVERKTSRASEFDLSDSYADAAAAVREANFNDDSDDENTKPAAKTVSSTKPSDHLEASMERRTSSAPPTPTVPGVVKPGGEKFTVRDLLQRVNTGSVGLGTRSTSSAGNMKALASQMANATGKSAATRTSVRDSAPALTVGDKSAGLRLENFQRVSESGRPMVTFEEQDCVGFYCIEFLSLRSICVLFKCCGKVGFTTSAVIHLESPIQSIAWDSQPPAAYLAASTLLTLTEIGWPSRHFNGSKKTAPLPLLTLTLESRPVHLIFSPSIFAKAAVVAEPGGVIKACSMAPVAELKEAGMQP